MPPAPERSFASDNAAGAHPAVMEAVAAANAGHALAYGDDPWTRECTGMLSELFGGGEALLTFTGTGANIVGLLSLLRPVDAVVCAQGAHIEVDEAGAAERILGAKLIDLPTPDGKLVPDQIRGLAGMIGNEHHVQPAVVSITQSTELGTLYSADDVSALADAAHGLGMRLHMDGARAANAAAALGGTPGALRGFTRDAGVDVITFGGTKNGMLGGEAVVFLDPSLAARARYLRKTAAQLPSKMRFIAAQFIALLTDDLWLRLAGHANDMAARLHAAVVGVPGVEVATPRVNSLFPVLPAAAVAQLREWSFVWDWDAPRRQVRWMTAWDTTAEDVERFAAGVAAAVGAARA